MRIPMMLALSLALTSTARAGVPAWCHVPEGTIDQGSFEDLGGDVEEAVVAVTYLECHPEATDPKQRVAIEDMRQRLMHQLDMTEADWSDAAAWAADDANKRSGREIDVKDDTKPWLALDPIEQFAVIDHPVIQTANNRGPTDAAYIVDALGPHLSEIGRLAYVRQCLATSLPVAWAMCQPDIDALDRKKLAAELRAAKGHTGYERMTIRAALDDLRPKLAMRNNDMTALLAKDPAYGKLFQIAAAARKEWAARWQSKSDALALADALDEALVTRLRKASAGCHDKTWAQLARAISAIPAKRFEARRLPGKNMDDIDWVGDQVLSTLLGDPDGYLAASSYALCEALEPTDDTLGGILGNWLGRWPGYRGPRTATQTAIETAGIELAHRDDKLEMPDIQRFWFGNAQSSGDSIDGVITSAKIDGAVATLTFPHKTITLPEGVNCHETNRLRAITSAGTLVYDTVCASYKMVTHDATHAPAKVAARYARGLAGGMVVAFGSGLAWAAWTKPGDTIPRFVLGQPVK